MIKILTVHHTTPEVIGYTTILFRNVLRILREKTDVHMTWVIHSPERIDTTSFEDQNTSFLDITDYKDAVEILKKVKPNLVYVIPGFSVIDYAFLIAAKQLKIKTIGGELGNFLFIKKGSGILSRISDIFNINLNSEWKRNFLKQKFFLVKHIFLIRTYITLKWNVIKITKNLSDILRLYLPGATEFTKFEDCDLWFVESQKTMDTLIEHGYDKSRIKITGNPTYDLAFQKIQKLEKRDKQKEIRVLILTMTVFGEKKKKMQKQRDLFIKGVITQINQYKKETLLTIKIHPTNENYFDYKKIIDSIDSKLVIHQKGDLAEYLKNTDIVITPVSSTGVVFTLISNIPIIIWNVFEVEEDVLLKNELAIECKNENDIIHSIEKALVFQPPIKKVDSFLSEYFFKRDGKASERIADIMLEMIDNK